MEKGMNIVHMVVLATIGVLTLVVCLTTYAQALAFIF